MARRWVVNGPGGLEIVTTSGWEPSDMICPCEDYWTIHTISLDKEKNIVIYDPEKVAKLQWAEEQAEKKRRVVEYKVQFKEQLSGYQAFVRHHSIKVFWVAMGAGLAIVSIQLWFHLRPS